MNTLLALAFVGQMTCDANLDNRVTIDELVAGINAALNFDCSECAGACQDGPCCAGCREFIVHDGQRLNGSFCADSEERIAYCMGVLCAQGRCSSVEP